jgi:hypothetical protein
MGKFKDYEPLHKDEIDYTLCKYFYNEVCVNVDCEWLADFPNAKEMCSIDNKHRCKYFEKEEKNG